MAKQAASFGKLMAINAAAAVIAVALSLAYLAAEPGRMHLGTILTTVFGVGITVLVAGGLASLMFVSSRSGRDEEVGSRFDPER